MKKKILNWLGLTTLVEFNELNNRTNEYMKLVSDLTKAINQYEELAPPTLKYEDYKPEQHGIGFNKELFDEWYSIYRRNQHQAHKLRKLSKHPHLLNAFMVEFGNFDWVSVRDYMEEVNWFWGNKLESPRIEDLMNCTIELIPDNNFDFVGNAMSSGGFTVALYYDNCEAVCKITFNKKK
jgi:hypothetical protein